MSLEKQKISQKMMKMALKWLKMAIKWWFPSKFGFLHLQRIHKLLTQNKKVMSIYFQRRQLNSVWLLFPGSIVLKDCNKSGLQKWYFLEQVDASGLGWAVSITLGGVRSGPRTLLGCQSAKPKHLKGNPRKLFYFCFAC